MKKEYLKPCIEIVDFDIDEPILDSLFSDQWGVGDEDEEGV